MQAPWNSAFVPLSRGALVHRQPWLHFLILKLVTLSGYGSRFHGVRATSTCTTTLPPDTVTLDETTPDTADKPKLKFKHYPLRRRNSRKRGGARKSRGWILGTDLVDDSVPLVLSANAFALAKLMRQTTSRDAVWHILDHSSPTHDTWDDIINVIVQLKREHDWNRTIQMCEWILQTSKFRPDILCYNLLMDAYGRSCQVLETERVFQLMRRSGCLANEDTFNVLIRAYGTAGLIDKAEATFYLMQRFGYVPGIIAFWIPCRVDINVVVLYFGIARTDGASCASVTRGSFVYFQCSMCRCVNGLTQFPECPSFHFGIA